MAFLCDIHSGAWLHMNIGTVKAAVMFAQLLKASFSFSIGTSLIVKLSFPYSMHSCPFVFCSLLKLSGGYN